MFQKLTTEDPFHAEGVVVQYFPDDRVYTVLTNRTHIRNCQYASSSNSGRGGYQDNLEPGDKVILYFGLGYPVIIAVLPRPQIETQTFRASLNSGQAMPTTGSTLHGDAVKLGAGQASDIVPGDQIIASNGGSMFGVLRGGTLLVRAARNAELLLSRLTGVVRLFSSNWEHFTDVCSDVIKNFGGRLYRYTGYAKTYAESKIESYKLHYYYGDVKAAEAVKTGYNSVSTAPAGDPILAKEQVTDGTGMIRMHRTLNDIGETEIWITNGTHFTRVTATAENLRFTWNDQNYINMNETSIHAFHKDGSDFIMDAAGIRGTKGASQVDINDNNITCTHNGSVVVLNDNQITATNGAGQMLVSDGVSKLVNGGHAITITGGGVAIT